MSKKDFAINDTLINILNGLDAYIYVSDPDTCEILYINDKMNKLFNDTDLTGKICWKVLQEGFTEQCSFCPNFKLKENHNFPIVWEEFNTVTKKFYRNTDTLIRWSDGRLVHLQHSIDLTSIKEAEELRFHKMRQQDFLSSLSMVFNSDDEFSLVLNNLLNIAGKHFNADHAYFVVNNDNDSWQFKSLWASENCQHYVAELYNIRKETITLINQNYDIFQTLDKGNPYLIENSNNFCELFCGSGNYAKTIYIIPIIIEKRLWGMLTLDSFSIENEFNKIEESFAKLISGIVSSGLERKIMVQNLILRDKMLEQAVIAARKANDAKSEFLSRMSHEIRTPMNAIIGLTYIAKECKDIDKIKHYLEKVDTSSKHLLALINDILDMSKIEANKLQLDYEDFNLEKLLINICNITSINLNDKNQNLFVNISKDLDTSYRGDVLRLSQAITNLLTNASKFSPKESTIKLEVSKIRADFDTTDLKISVIDNGIGMSKDTLSRLFTPFEQADGGIARKYGGTGLGLVITKKIVNLMGGDIWVESELGQGTTITFSVRLGNCKKNNKTTISEGIDKNNLKVLIVDDSPEILEFFSSILNDFDIQTEVAKSGEEAVGKVVEAEGCNKPFNIIFMDWKMPGMNGIEAAKIIKEKTKNNCIVILISVAELQHVEKMARESGVNKFLQKPLFSSTIIDTINEIYGAKILTTEEERSSALPDLSGKKILLAEDIKINVEVVTAFLRDTSAEIIVAENGIEACEIFLKDTSFDLILMDIQMPLMDGYDATRKIRSYQFEKAKKIPIIAMTANAYREDVEKSLQAGMNDHIAKPIDPQILADKLRLYLLNEANKKQKLKEGENFMDNYLPYIDVTEGLNRIRGNKKLYAKLLKSYLLTADFETVQAQLLNNNINAAKDAIHSIKGVSANLSINKTFELSKQLESDLKEGNDYIQSLYLFKECMQKTKTLVEQLITELEQQV